MTIKQLVTKIETLPNCIVYPSKGIPAIEEAYTLPDDIREFYDLCGGVSLFTSAENVVNIVPPDEFILANPVIVGERCEEDITADWYIVANDGNGDYLTVDLNKDRVGRCYDSFWDRHGVVGECAIIAISFTDLLERLVDNKGQRWYWLRDGFNSLGDAYDEV